jgi:uncharacterized protein DUF3780
VNRPLGKELCVLAWTIERLDPEKIGMAVRNWLALRPEERWWLFGMTAIATGGIGDADKGWRRDCDSAARSIACKARLLVSLDSGFTLPLQTLYHLHPAPLPGSPA